MNALKNQNLIEQLTLEEKASLCSGLDMWHTKPLESIGLKSIMMTDGPHGLRKQHLQDVGQINKSVNATAFPTASLSSCCWDRALLEKLGNAIAEECLQEEVSVILGPGVNIKRSPLCGRNFEYFSEDPFLAGEMAAHFIKGVENRGIGTSLKHFCANNQEYSRFVSSSEIDERTLREIYLAPFEKAVKIGKPSSVMCAYNKLNGVPCSDNGKLLTDILRTEWGFNGVVVSDWGAVNNRIEGIKTGLDLEMPSSGGRGDRKIVDAVNSGDLSIESLDIAVDNMLTLILKGLNVPNMGVAYNVQEHTDFATTLAESSAVLLKNEDSNLPLKKTEKVLIIGELAKLPRYQGGGSSHINPLVLTNLIDSLTNLNIDVDYEPGYHVTSGKTNKKLLARAVAKASKYDKIVLYVGLTEEYEAEGFDRKNLSIPLAHSDLINQISAVNENVTVVISAGSPIEMPWANNVKSILMMYLSGAGGGLATANLLYGNVNPSGKLAESFLNKIEDSSCYYDYKFDKHASFYTEGIYVGYRLYDILKTPLLFPFGHGLSYTSFEYSDLDFNKDTNKLTFKIQNIGDVDGYEIAQVYIHKQNGTIFTPFKQLKGFEKVFIKSGETAAVSINLDKLSFSYYDTVAKDWLVESATYQLLVGGSSADIKLSVDVELLGDTPLVKYDGDLWYNAPTSNNVPFEDYEKLLGRVIDKTRVIHKKGAFTLDDALEDMTETSKLARTIIKLGSYIIRKSMQTTKQDSGYLMIYEMFKSTPLLKLSATSQDAFSLEMADAFLIMLNGKFFKGLRKLLK